MRKHDDKKQTALLRCLDVWSNGRMQSERAEQLVSAALGGDYPYADREGLELIMLLRDYIKLGDKYA